MNQSLKEKIKLIPHLPGVYLWKNIDNEIIYIGKAKDLNNRINQYLQGSINSYKTKKMMQEVSDIEIIICANEHESFIKEQNYIKQHVPKYNIALLDDKYYPYLVVSLKTNKLEIKKKNSINKKEKAFYYGPFSPKYRLRHLIKILEREFLYDNGLKINNNDYWFWLNKYNQIKEILKLKNNNFINHLTSQMEQNSLILNYEIAMEYRDAVVLLQALKDKQIPKISNQHNVDVFSFKVIDNWLVIYVSLYQYGIPMENKSYLFEIKNNLDLMINDFLEQYYQLNDDPSVILIDTNNLDITLDFSYQNKISHTKNEFLNLLEINQTNLNNFINLEFEQHKQKYLQHQQLNNEVNMIFNESKQVNNLFLFDNSFINDKYLVGVVIAYTNLIRNNKLNRKFNHINLQKQLAKHGDPMYMYLTVSKYLQQNHLFLTNDDIFIVDGAKAQIDQALYALKEFNLENKIKVFGLIKDQNHKTRALINAKGQEIQITNNLFKFLTNCQFEVDKYAKQYMNKNLTNNSLSSGLLKIKGIGPKTETILLKHFLNYSNIYNASFEELSKVINPIKAQNIRDWVESNKKI